MTAQNYANWLTVDKVMMKVKMVTFLNTAQFHFCTFPTHTNIIIITIIVIVVIIITLLTCSLLFTKVCHCPFLNSTGFVFCEVHFYDFLTVLMAIPVNASMNVCAAANGWITNMKNYKAKSSFCWLKIIQ